MGIVLNDNEVVKSMPSDMVDYVVEYSIPAYINSELMQWYRRYKSGWVEQGFYLFSVPPNSERQITFPIPYAGIHHYIITITGTYPAYWKGAASRTAESIIVVNTSTYTNFIDVYVCGKAAS